MAKNGRIDKDILESIYDSNHKEKIAKHFISKDLAITFLGWQMGLEPTTFRTTI